MNYETAKNAKNALRNTYGACAFLGVLGAVAV
jgi:hypothetical protein